MKQRWTTILTELKDHAPFTLFGAATGIFCMLLFKGVGSEVNHGLFKVFHPAHVVLSAIVTASLFELYKGKANFLAVLLVGYFGSIGIATLSDCVLPFFGESILGVAIPMHADLHSHQDPQATGDHAGGEDHERASEMGMDGGWSNIRARLHLGFIEEWYLVNPAALLGIVIAFFWPRTKFPHAGHVLVSTWASSFHVLMNTQRELSIVMLIGVFVVLFIAVWLPCCISDIVFPLLFVGSDVHPAHAHHHGSHRKRLRNQYDKGEFEHTGPQDAQGDEALLHERARGHLESAD
ncbi:MAG: hypothetical protein P8Z79_03500 [Sedimentisphaerales bacterium]|jgi:hypothetical protein